MKSELVSIGLRAKTARAITVILGGPADSPIVLLKREIRLADPKVPATAQPYHEVMELPWEQSQRAVRKFATLIERVATRAIANLIADESARGARIAGVSIIGAPDRDLARIGNQHIRAHAAEGILFRRVLELAAAANGLKWQTFSDRNFDTDVAARLGNKHSLVKQKLGSLNRSVPPPWRSDEKQAALAAWLALHG